MNPESKEARTAGKQFIKRQRRAAVTALDVYSGIAGISAVWAAGPIELAHLIAALHHLADHEGTTWAAILDEANNYYGEDRNTARGPRSAPTPAPLAPPAPGLHPAPLDGPRRSDEISWVRDYLVVHLNQADVPPEVQPNITELDRWAAQVVDHLVRQMIRPDGGGLRGMISLTEAPPPVPPIDPTQNEIRWMVGDQVRINKPGHGWHTLKGEVGEVSYTGVKVWVQGRSTRWFAPEELIFLAGRPDNPPPKPEQLHANAVRAAAAAFPDPGGLAEALATSARAAENAASWEGAWPDPQRPATPDADEDGEDDR